MGSRLVCLLYTELRYQKQIQERYSAHRETRNGQQKIKLLDRNFPGVSIDPILLRLSDPTIEPGYKDPRYCLVFWARPTQKVKNLIHQVQQKLLAVAPSEFPISYLPNLRRISYIPLQ